MTLCRLSVEFLDIQNLNFTIKSNNLHRTNKTGLHVRRALKTSTKERFWHNLLASNIKTSLIVFGIEASSDSKAFECVRKRKDEKR